MARKYYRESKRNTATGFAILAVAMYAISIPVSKLLMEKIAPTMLAALLYLGAGLGMLFLTLIKNRMGKKDTDQPLTKRELPYTVAMVILDMGAPILLMMGLKWTPAANASLLNNFEIVATSVIAAVIFKEVLSKRLKIAIALVSLSSILLSFSDISSFSFSGGSLLILLATICWGFENNCTRMLSSKSTIQIVIIKGCFSGLGAMAIALLQGEKMPHLLPLLSALGLGFIAYGLSIHCYIRSQRDLGASKTSAWYALNPFIGAFFSYLFFRERLELAFFLALAAMVAGTYFIITDSIAIQHIHAHEHIHEHIHEHGACLSHQHQHGHIHSHDHIHRDPEGEVHDHTHKDLWDHAHEHGNQ